MRPSAPGVAVGMPCCKLGAAFAGSHNPSKRKLIIVNRIKKRFGFMPKLYQDSVMPPVPRQFSEWLKERTDEIQDMSKIIWKMLFIKLPAIETINKQA
jgi:hypothetical protein